MNILNGETPKQKYEFLQKILKQFSENNSGVEVVLLTICDSLEKKGDEMFRASGNESYIERCFYYDAKMLIYGLTNKYKIAKTTYFEWRDEVRLKR